MKPGQDSVIWENKPSDGTPVNTWVYTITYADNARTTVTLDGPLAGTDADQMAADIRTLLESLPDISVEQMFLTGDNYEMGKSKRFTIRTTERQQSLVQASLDRLMRSDDGKTLMDTATMTLGPVTGAIVDLLRQADFAGVHNRIVRTRVQEA